VGDVTAALGSSARVVEAYYESPFLAHATMEPVNCTADVRDGHCYVTGPLQMQTSGAGVVAAVTGLPVDRVHVQVTRLGGGFGRRLLSDYAAEAAVVSQRIKAPVQVVGTREDDLRHDYYRPAGARQFRIGLDANGRIVAWDCHLVNLSRNAYRRGSNTGVEHGNLRDGGRRVRGSGAGSRARSRAVANPERSAPFLRAALGCVDGRLARAGACGERLRD
jgi:isoquinoline 1-oxidoreductase beta subunit